MYEYRVEYYGQNIRGRIDRGHLMDAEVYSDARSALAGAREWLIGAGDYHLTEVMVDEYTLNVQASITRNHGAVMVAEIEKVPAGTFAAERESRIREWARLGVITELEAQEYLKAV